MGPRFTQRSSFATKGIQEIKSAKQYFFFFFFEFMFSKSNCRYLPASFRGKSNTGPGTCSFSVRRWQAAVESNILCPDEIILF